MMTYLWLWCSEGSKCCSYKHCGAVVSHSLAMLHIIHCLHLRRFVIETAGVVSSCCMPISAPNSWEWVSALVSELAFLWRSSTFPIKSATLVAFLFLAFQVEARNTSKSGPTTWVTHLIWRQHPCKFCSGLLCGHKMQCLGKKGKPQVTKLLGSSAFLNLIFRQIRPWLRGSSSSYTCVEFWPDPWPHKRKPGWQLMAIAAVSRWEVCRKDLAKFGMKELEALQEQYDDGIRYHLLRVLRTSTNWMMCLHETGWHCCPHDATGLWYWRFGRKQL